MRILLTGKDGQVGWELQRSLGLLGEIIALDRNELDLASANSIVRAMRDVEPDIVVNAAAYTAVDRAESEPDLAMAINGVAPGVIAHEAKRLGALVVHYSTDYVFDGTKDGLYEEDDTPHPLNVYGRSKLAGEIAIRAVGIPHYIFRTGWIYAARGHNFVRTILGLAREKTELKIVNDQIGAPTWARSVAVATAQILTISANGLPGTQNSDGLYHLTAAGAISWFGFAQAILAAAKSIYPVMNMPKLTPIHAIEFPLPARRPLNSRLDNSRLFSTFGLTLPSWDAMLQQCMQEMIEENDDGSRVH